MLHMITGKNCGNSHGKSGLPTRLQYTVLLRAQLLIWRVSSCSDGQYENRLCVIVSCWHVRLAENTAA